MAANSAAVGGASVENDGSRLAVECVELGPVHEPNESVRVSVGRRRNGRATANVVVGARRGAPRCFWREGRGAGVEEDRQELVVFRSAGADRAAECADDDVNSRSRCVRRRRDVDRLGPGVRDDEIAHLAAQPAEVL